MRLLASALVLLLLVGCSAGPSSEHQEQVKEPAQITLTPVELFEGSGERFKPFLGVMSGAFKLRYEGDKPKAHLDIDIWENGEKVSSAGSIGDLFFSTDEQTASDEIEIIISINKVSVESEELFKEIKVSVRNNSGYGFYTLTAPWEEKFGTQGLIDYGEPIIFNSDDSVHVFGLHATSTNQIHIADFSSTESLREIEKAIIFTLRFEE